MHRLPSLLLLTALLLGCGRPDAPPPALTANPMSPYIFSCRPIDSLYVERHLPELERQFGGSLTADAYRAKLLAALAFYPELRGVEIELRRQRLRTSMAARPLRLGAHRGRRRYALLVDDVSDRASDFRKSAYSAQIGCFLHELGHIAHYEGRSNTTLIGQGLAYVSRQQYKNRYERIADSHVLRHGGGYYLYLYRTFTFREADLPPAYLAFKERNYDGPDTVLAHHLAYLEARGWAGTDCGEVVSAPDTE